jgi:hypothetical protein
MNCGIVAVGRIAAVGVVTIAILAVAQESQGGLLVRVTDAAGWVIPGAQVQVDQPPIESALKTARNGEIYLDLIHGRPILKITAPGFENSKQRVDSRDGGKVPIIVSLRISGCRGGVTVVSGPEMPLDRPSVDTFITLAPLEALAPLKNSKYDQSRGHGRGQKQTETPQARANGGAEG